MKRHGCFLFAALMIWLVILFTGCVNVPNQIILDSVTAKKALDVAIKQIEKPYVFGGRGPDEFDCSGLIVWSYKQVYSKLKFRDGNRVVSDVAMNTLWKYNVEQIPLSSLEPGDVIFITDNETKITHGGLFIQWVDDKTLRMVHASAADHKQKVDYDEWPVEGRIRDQWLVGAGKLKTVY
jgi:cell wall-associated NlpC family hydrolase